MNTAAIRRPGRAAGFTLIELLVVFGLIALIAIPTRRRLTPLLIA